jgi:hypothetical protein
MRVVENAPMPSDNGEIRGTTSEQSET